MANTQFNAGLGYGARRYGSFAGKHASSAGPHDPGVITIFRAGFGFGGQRYALANFAGKGSGATISEWIVHARRRGKR